MEKIINTSVSTLIVVALVAAGIGFFGGQQYAKSQVGESVSGQNNRGNFSGAPGRAMNGGNGAGRLGSRGGAVAGEVLSKDDKSITVKSNDGGSKIIFYSTSTQFMKTEPGAVSDIEIGKSVFVNGPANSDGTMTAQSIQLGRFAPPSIIPSSTVKSEIK